MRYFVAATPSAVPYSDEPVGVLIHNSGWNDWYKYKASFSLHVKIGKETISIGSLKIGEKGLTPVQETPKLDPVFESLDERFFSLGANEDYYENAVRVSEKHNIKILEDLRDSANDLSIFDRFISEDVMSESLTRSVSYDQVRGRFHRLARGDATPTEFAFAHLLPNGEELATIDSNTGDDGTLSFIVDPTSKPPSNIHVLIGRNGVGKTTRLTGIVHSLLNLSMPNGGDPGRMMFYKDDGTGDKSSSHVPDFANLVSVAFSAFDPFIPPTQAQVATSKLGYAYIGLKRSVEAQQKSGASETFARWELAEQFAKSAFACRSGLRGERWSTSLEVLEADPLFAEANVRSLVTELDSENWHERATTFFEKLSSGHGIVLLTITRLVELVDERTLILLDEPEGHLHPPLLSAFVRALSGLLSKRNGVAIIATHSPVVLQEVPATCVWYMNRSIANAWAERPPRETFAENVGVLTRDVFGLEVVKSGFHQMIAAAVTDAKGDYETVLKSFDGSLGEEGHALARAMCIRWSKGRKVLAEAK